MRLSAYRYQAILWLALFPLSTPAEVIGGEVSLEGTLRIQETDAWPDDELDWDELTDEQRNLLRSHRYTERLWNCDAEPDSLYRWNELSPERQEMWKLRGWNEERWEEEDDCEVSMQMSTPEEFKPLVVDITVPQLDEVTMERLRAHNAEIRLVEGEASYTNEEFAKSMPLNQFIDKVQRGEKDLYMHLEELMPEKRAFQKLVGDRVYNHLLPAIQQHGDLTKEGIWKSEWDTLDRESLDWAMFIGAKESFTKLHYDSDVFNFLYVAKGRKRIVMIPNDERTKGSFKTETNADGGTGWGSMINILDRSVPLPEYAVEVEVGPGQGIAIPHVAWHAVENLETSLAFSLRIVD